MAMCVLRTVLAAPDILKTKKLTPLDWKMSGTYTVTYRNFKYVLPIGKIDDLLSEEHDSPTFGAVRELFAADVYLRAFRVLPTGKPVIDLGSNRGITSIIAAIALEAPIVVGVEPEGIYVPVLKLLLERNVPAMGRVTQEVAFASGSDFDGHISINSILRTYDIKEIGFVKIDIEGGEYGVFRENTEWLDVCDNISMEIHRKGGDPKELEEILKSRGFQTKATDQFGAACRLDNPDSSYLYASKTGALM